MKNIYKILSSIFILVTMSCSNDNEQADLDKVSAPSNIDAVVKYSSDNSGNITFYPTGDGVTKFEIFYGDGTVAPGIVNAAASVMHTFPEGVYNVKIVGTTLNGQKTEVIKPVTMTFVAPTDFVANVDPVSTNGLAITVKAKANLEKNFLVYFGDVANEVPTSFLEDEEINHTYATPGTYQVRVVAQSPGAAFVDFFKSIVATPSLLVLLPVNFESPVLPYNFINFGGGLSSKIPNPQASGINLSPNVAQMVKNAGEVYGGSVLALSSPINFSTLKKMKVKVFSPRVGAKLLLKVENNSNGSLFFQKEVSTTVANTWEELTFDYTAISTTVQYQKLVLIFDNGTMGNGTANYTFLFDDIRQSN